MVQRIARINQMSKFVSEKHDFMTLVLHQFLELSVQILQRVRNHISDVLETVDMIADKTPVNTIAAKIEGKSCSAAFGNKYSGSSNPGKSA